MAIIINVLIAAWLVLAPWQTTPKPPVGFVLSMWGTWQIDRHDGKRDGDLDIVKLGQGVPPGATLSLTKDNRLDTGSQFAIQVMLLNNKTAGCPNTAACQGGVTIPAALNDRSSMLDKLSDVFALIFQSPERWVGLVSRDIGRVNLADGIVRVDRGRLAVTDLLKNIPAGDYHLQFTAVPDAGPPRPAGAIDLHWSGQPMTAQVSFGAGLYRVRLLRATGSDMVGREAWILAAGSPQANALRRRYDAAVATTRAWGADIPEFDVERFLHAYLAQLARDK